MRPFIIGTAGHIDHGKSALVKALTGIDPDRLPEERRRGITIDLGFAHGLLTPGVEAAYVDVPGHERFVRTMVAGAHGLDVVLLVVALDEGVMPQTREHADICRLLGVPRAVIVLTKDDLAPQLDTGWPALVEEDVRALGTPFDVAPLVRVSARSGAGVEALKALLAGVASDLPTRPAGVAPLLPIDRVFSVKGHGTVVTGTLLTGGFTVGDPVELAIPAPRNVRVCDGLRARALQVHGHAVHRAVAGQRVAVNLPDIDVVTIPRGAALVGAGTAAIRQGTLLDVELQIVSGTAPLRTRARLTVHLGTAQALATVDLLGAGELLPGEKRLAQLRLDRALPALREQRLVLRGFRALTHGGHTVGGGRVLLVDSQRRRPGDSAVMTELAASSERAAQALVMEAGSAGVALHRLDLLLNGVPEIRTVRLGENTFARAALEQLTDGLRKTIRAHGSISRESARSALGPKVHPLAFDAAVAALGAGFTAGDTLEVPAVREDPIEQRIAERLAGTGLSPPTVAELAVQCDLERSLVELALRGLVRRGRAVRLTEDLFVDATAAAAFRGRAVARLHERGSLTTLELKEMIGASRKFAIPLCEWLDREKVTLRIGDKRTLRKAGGP